MEMCKVLLLNSDAAVEALREGKLYVLSYCVGNVLHLEFDVSPKMLEETRPL